MNTNKPKPPPKPKLKPNPKLKPKPKPPSSLRKSDENIVKYVFIVFIILIIFGTVVWLIPKFGNYYYIPVILGAIIIPLITSLILFEPKVKDAKPPPLRKSDRKIIENVFIVVFVLLTIFGIMVWLIPNFASIKQLFMQISNVSYVLLYTIGAILFYLTIPDKTLDQYAKIINPAMLLVGIVAFYRSSRSSMNGFNTHYERIKMLIILFCMITLSATFYNINPGGAASSYFGYPLLITIITSVFAFLYLMVLIGLPNNGSATNTNLLSGFSTFGAYGSIGLVAFIAVIAGLLSTQGIELFNDKRVMITVILLVLEVCILMSVALVANTYGTGAEFSNQLVQKSLLILFGFIMSGLFIFWLAYTIQHFSGKSGITSFVLNLLLMTVILGLIYQTVFTQFPAGNAKKNAFFGIFSNMFYYLACLVDSKKNTLFALIMLIVNSVFYIPCLISELFRGIGGLLSGQGTSETIGSWIMLLTAIVLFVAYFKTPTLYRMLNAQGGKQLVNQPINTDMIYSLGNYIELHGSESFDYKYAISCWIYIDAAGANMNANYNKYTSLLNCFGSKPNVLYNGKRNTLMITMDQNQNAARTSLGDLVDVDDEGNRIVYMNDQFLLQKWNNLIINYNGGTMDIFLNGELVQSSIEVVPYYRYDLFTIGENNGVKGGICNVVYYKEPLEAQNIYMIYNTAKHLTPPVVDDSINLPIERINPTVIKQRVHSNIVKPVDSKIVRPADSKIVRPADSTIVKLFDTNIVKPVDSTIVKPIDSTIVNPVDKYLR